MSIPNHIAIIPDGNRRWAKAQRLKPWEGHAEGAKRYWEISGDAHKQGVDHLTLWAASYDNLQKRSKLEVKFLLKLFEEELSKPEILQRCLENEIKARIIGEWREFVSGKHTILAVENLIEKTKHFSNKSMNILLAYDGKREMLSAANALVASGEQVSEKSLRNSLWTAELPDVDLVIRTGGEPHWSAGFMMWLTANSQFYFTDVLWPDFNKQALKKALDDYESRERRLGK